MHACLYRPIPFPFVFTADMPGYLMPAKLDTHCILQIYSDNTSNSTKTLVLYCTAEAENYTEKSSSHATHGLELQ